MSQLSAAQTVSSVPLDVLHHHDPGRVLRFEEQDKVGESPQRVAAVAALVQVERKVPWITLNLPDCLTEFRFKPVGDMCSGLLMLIIDDLIEIPLNQRMEGKRAFHGSSTFMDTAPELLFAELLDLARQNLLFPATGFGKRILRRTARRCAPQQLTGQLHPRAGRHF